MSESVEWLRGMAFTYGLEPYTLDDRDKLLAIADELEAALRERDCSRQAQRDAENTLSSELARMALDYSQRIADIESNS